MRVTVTAFAVYLVASASVHAASDDIFMVRKTDQPQEAVVEAIKEYAKSMDWRYLGDNKVKKGEVTLVKICIPEVGQLIWSVGLQLSAMLPCGNIGIYDTADGTEISVLHPRYLSILHPDPQMDRAGELGGPLLTDMLDAVAGN